MNQVAITPGTIVIYWQYYKVIHYIGNNADDKNFKNNFAGINNSCIFAVLEVIKIMVKL